MGLITLLLGVIAMNKQFMYINGTIVVSDENVMKPAIPYVDNIEDKLCRRNDIL